jgi:UDP-N-acetyl-2-amino-2-deoxyglucuronate dehydrogenase
MDGVEIEFSEGFGDLHTRSYHMILAGEGFGLRDAARAVNISYSIRTFNQQP